MPGARGLVVVLAVALGIPALAVAVEPPRRQGKIRVAVLEVKALGADKLRAELLSEVALTEAGSLPGYDVIGWSDIGALLGFEKQRKVMGCTEDSRCLEEIGGALGVEYILLGSLGQIGSLARLDLKLVETRRARVKGRIGVSVEGQEEKLVAAVQKAVRDLLAPVTADAQAAAARPAPEPAPAPEPRLEARPPAATRESAPAPAAPLTAAPAPARAGPAGVAAKAPSSSRRTWAYVTGATGLALLGGGVFTGLQVRAALDDAKQATDVARYDDARSKARSLAPVADGLMAAGAVGVGVGTYLFFTSRPPPVAVGAAPVPGGAVATIAGGF